MGVRKSIYMQSTCNSLRSMADKIRTLEDLYKKIQGCFVIWSKQQKLVDNYLSDHIIRSYQFNDPLLNNMKYTRFVYLIGMFLKFLSGRELSTNDIKDMTPNILLFNVFTPGLHNILLFNQIVDPYINLLSTLVQFDSCTATLAYKDYNIGASTNLYHIANRIEAIEMFYNQAQNTCIGLEEFIRGFGFIYNEKKFINNVPIYSDPRELTFHETMKIIGTYLKFLRGERLNDNEAFYMDNFTSAGDNFLFGLSPLFKKNINILPFDIVVEPYITWLSDISNQCRHLNLSLTSTDKESLYSLNEYSSLIH